ncbi:MAG: hypothetical protein R3B69_01915 [Candidatus Paceibacterota bacterium]
MTPGNEHAQIEKLLDRNAELLAENNKLLKKIHRNGLWAFWIRVVWYLVLIGLPFALYFYVLEPYFNALGANYEVFRAGVSEIPGLKGLDQILESLNQRPQ